MADAERRPPSEILRDALAAYDTRDGAGRRIALDGCVTGSGESVADVGEDDLLRGFGA